MIPSPGCISWANRNNTPAHIDIARFFGRSRANAPQVVPAPGPSTQNVARSFKTPLWKFEPEIKPLGNPDCPKALVRVRNPGPRALLTFAEYLISTLRSEVGNWRFAATLAG